jgi:hypothetical protein
MADTFCGGNSLINIFNELLRLVVFIFSTTYLSEMTSDNIVKLVINTIAQTVI